MFRVVKPAPRSVTEAAPPALPPGVFTNRVDRSERPLTHTALVIDTLNTAIPDQAHVRTQLLAMLGTMEIRDPIAIFVLGQKFRVLQDFTVDAALLRKAMETFKPEASQKLRMATTPTPRIEKVGPGGTSSGISAAMMARSFAEMRDFGNQDRGIATIDILEQLGRYLKAFPGKKSIVWISNAFPTRALRNHPDLIRELNAADVAIHGVVAAGLPGPIPILSSPVYADTVKWVADQTGGRAFYDRNDIGQAVSEAIHESDVSYTLGFYSQHEKADGNFHLLKIKLDKPGLEARHREGYFDIEPKLAPADAATLVERASRISASANAIGLVAAIARKGDDFDVAVQVDFKDLRLLLEDGRWKGAAELAFLALSAGGHVIQAATKSLDFDMPEDAYRVRLREGFALEQTIPAQAGIAQIRVVIIDRAGGAGAVSLKP